MKQFFTKAFFWALLLHFAVASGQAVKTASLRLQTEYLVNPLGIDNPRPRMSWAIMDGDRGVQQSSFTITLGTDSGQVSSGKGSFFAFTGKGGSQLFSYEGKPLSSFTKYYWQVRSLLNTGKEIISPVASFETGMFDRGEWKGSWISDSRDIDEKRAPYFRKRFGLWKKVVSARAYIAAAGLYELSINGRRIGDHRLDPMYTRFDRRNLYVSYDVTAELKQGDNAIGVLLGNGWYNHQSTAVWYFDKAPWRNRPAFCMDLRLTYNDGSVETISTDRDWKTTLSPVIFNSIYTGEHYDARLEIPHWDEPGYMDTAWKQSIYRAAPSQHILAQSTVPIRDVQEIATQSMRKVSDTDYVFDLGRNFAGVSEIRLSGERGTVIRLKHGERLYPNGHVDQSNIDVHYRPTGNSDPFQTDIYTLKGNGSSETFRTRFNYKGFQYVEVTSDQPIKLEKESLKGHFMHSDVRSSGKIESSNPVIDKIWSAANNSYLSNLFGYPTDCPQREKNGWTGDAQTNVETGLYNFDAITIYEKWMADHRDEQQPNGVLPSIIPTSGWGYEWGNGPDWTSSIAIIPWNLYLFYGDSQALRDNYDNIKHYVDHINDLFPAGLCSWGLGDWIPVKSETPVELTSTCYYYADANILAAAAQIFNREKDYQIYTALAKKIKNAFNEKYLNKSTGIYHSGTQTQQSAPLFWGLVPEEWKKTVAKNLADRVLADSVKLDVGLLGSKTILNALSDNGYADLAYRLASRETEPSWGWWIVNGATTLYENWPINAASDISLNHIMFGEISAWMYKALGGMKPDAASPGFKHILLHPHFVKGLDHFSAEHESPFGWIKSSWSKQGKDVNYTVTVPPGATATLVLDGSAPQKFSSGTFMFHRTDSN